MIRLLFVPLQFILAIAALSVLLIVGAAANAQSADAPAQNWREARRALQEERWGAAIGYFEPLVEANPHNYFAYYLLGSALHGHGEYNRALQAHFMAARYSQASVHASFNAARSYSKLNQQEMAFLWLERALLAGFDDFETLSSDADLADLRTDPRFDQLIKRSRVHAKRRMPVGTEYFASRYDKAAKSVSVRSIGAVLQYGTGGVAVSPAGEIYVGDFGDHLYKIEKNGDYSTFVSGIEGASGNAFDSRGNLFQSHFRGGKISKITPSGEVTDFVTEGLVGPVGIAIDSNDNLYVANCDGQYISKITPQGGTSIFARGPLFYCPNGITLDDDGNVYVANFHHGVIVKITSGGEPQFFRQMPQEGAAYVLYVDNALYVTGYKSNMIFKLSMEGDLSVLAGDGTRGIKDGNGLDALFGDSNGLAASPNGNCLYTNDGIGDWRNGNSPDPYPGHSVLREIKLYPGKNC